MAGKKLLFRMRASGNALRANCHVLGAQYSINGSKKEWVSRQELVIILHNRDLADGLEPYLTANGARTTAFAFDP